MSTYLKFFELEKSPFDTSAQSNLVLGTKALRGAFAEIERGMAEGSARICVTGDAGMGKTSLARALPKLLGDRARVVLLLNPSLPWTTLRSAIVKQLELAKGMLSRNALLEAAHDGRRLILAVDQAELTSEETLEHLDILLGYRSDEDEQLITCILLANMHEAREQEECPLLWWLDKLNTLQLEFAPIPAAGVQSYIAKHLKRAGWKGGHLFSPEAAEHIHRLTGGVPRKVSEICERVLEEAAEQNVRQIGPDLVEELFGEVKITSSPAAAMPRDPESVTLDEAASKPSTDSRAEPEGPSLTSAPAPRREVLTPDPAPEPEKAPRKRRMFKSVDAPISLDAFFGGSSGSEDAGVSTEIDSSDPEQSDRPQRRGRMLAMAAMIVVLGGVGAWITLGSGLLEEPPEQITLQPKLPSRAPAAAGDELVLARKKGPVPVPGAAEDVDDWTDPLLGLEPPVAALSDEAKAQTEPGDVEGQAETATDAPAQIATVPEQAPEMAGAETAAVDPLAPERDAPAALATAPSPAPPAAPAGFANPADEAIDKPFW